MTITKSHTKGVIQPVAALLVLFLLCAHSLPAQTIVLKTTPRTQTISGATATFTLHVEPVDGFNASVFLNASSPTLPGATFTITPNRINSPYLDSATLIVTLTGPKEGGEHAVIIKAENGPLDVRDTVTITIPARTAWRVFPKFNYLKGARWFALDHRGIGWFAVGDSFVRFNGVERKSFAPPKVPNQVFCWSIALDSSGDLWAAFKYGSLARLHDTTWTEYAQVDSSIGLTEDVLGAMMGDVHADGRGNIWIGGHVKFDGMRFIYYDLKQMNIDAYSDNYPGTNMVIDHESNLWIGRDQDGIAKFDGTYWTLYSNKELGLNLNEPLTPLAVDANNHIWGISKYGGAVVEVENGHAILHDSNSFLAHDISAITFDRQGTMWAGRIMSSSDHRESGLARLSNDTLWHYTIANSGLPDNDIIFLGTDDNGTVWIGTKNGDLTLLDGNTPPSSAFLANVPDPGTAKPLGGYQLEAWPNPITNSATVHLLALSREHLRLSITNSLGRVVAVLLDGTFEPGDQLVPFNSDGLPAGTYFLRLTTADAVEVKPIVVMR